AGHAGRRTRRRPVRRPSPAHRLGPRLPEGRATGAARRTHRFTRPRQRGGDSGVDPPPGPRPHRPGGHPQPGRHGDRPPTDPAGPGRRPGGGRVMAGSDNPLGTILRLARPQRRKMAFGLLLAIVTAVSGLGLLVLSGWFIAASAVAGATTATAVAFNFTT